MCIHMRISKLDMCIAHVTACRAQHPADQAEQGGVQYVAAVAPTDDLDDLNWLLESSQIDPKYAESALRPGMYLLSCSKYVLFLGKNLWHPAIYRRP